jgi:hypothetical protein
MEEYTWNMICILREKRDVNSLCNVTACGAKHYWFSDVQKCHSILCMFVQFWSGVAEVSNFLECGAALVVANQY